MFDEALLDDEEELARRDSDGLLWALATAGSQVRRAVETVGEFGLEALRSDTPPRALLVATDAPPSVTVRVVTRLSCEATPALAWHGVELPRWAGPADALLIGAVDGHHPRLAELAEQGARRGLLMAVVAPAGSQVAAAAGRAPVHALPTGLNRRAFRWAVITPLLQALDALGVHAVPPGLLAAVADGLDQTAEICRPGSDAFTNPAKALALEFSDTLPVIAGAGALAGVAARAIADALQTCAGAPAVSVSLPDGAGRAGALLRGAGPSPAGYASTGGGTPTPAGYASVGGGTPTPAGYASVGGGTPTPAGYASVGGGTPTPDRDFFRDRVEGAGPRRARLLVVGDDGAADDPALGSRSGAQIQLDEVAARRAASALHTLARELGLRSSSVDVPPGPALVRFAAATAFGDFTASYLALGLGLDPGALGPAERLH
ncbi:MAG: hypothetical protein EPN43_01370 [Jatrophihabitans sp.]|nr:MAG: hypothetical protein EPN43_01370 [Jatrophihabitans sp.]